MLKRHQQREQIGLRRYGTPAAEPTQRPRPLTWSETVKRVKKAISDDNISIIAAGVAFYLLVGLIPAIAALISIYGLIADPRQVEQQFSLLANFLPSEVTQQLTEQMKRISANNTAAGIGAVIGFIAALWSATSATKAVITGLNIVFHEKEKRGFFKLTFVTLTITLGAVILGMVAVGSIVALPQILKFVAFMDAEKATWLANLIRWPLLAFVAVFGLTLLYRFGPSHRRPKWHLFTWGSAIAVFLWVVTSALFSFYVANFGKYNETYGSLGAVVILLMWLYLSAFIVLLGAEINAVREGTKTGAIETAQTHG